MSTFSYLNRIRTLHRGNYGTINGQFTPLNCNKYNGPSKIIYRSSWELRFMQWCDLNNNIIEWGSENIVVLYLDPTNIDQATGKPTQHKYFIDFSITVKQRDGSIKKYFVEIKPSSQCKMPKKTKKTNEKSYQDRLRIYLKNMAKWKSANEIAKQRGAQFIIITEKELGIK